MSINPGDFFQAIPTGQYSRVKSSPVGGGICSIVAELFDAIRARTGLRLMLTGRVMIAPASRENRGFNKHGNCNRRSPIPGSLRYLFK